MLSRAQLVLFLCLGTPLLLLGNCATPKEATTEASIYSPQKDEELFGTWINLEHDGVTESQKFINYPWGLTEGYHKMDSEYPSNIGTYFIVDKTEDKRGRVLYKVVWQFQNNPTVYRRYLVRLDVEQGTWEQVWSYDHFPSEIELSPENEYFYDIYYRHR